MRILLLALAALTADEPPPLPSPGSVAVQPVAPPLPAGPTTPGTAQGDEAQVEHVYVRTNGIRMHVAMAGPDDGPVVIMLHGFPDFWYGWRHQMLPLAQRGWRVLVPDQRGYNLTDKPTDVEAYAVDTLVADVVGLMDALGVQKAHVVAHDWGAGVAWRMAQVAPERMQRLVIINVPHLGVMRRTLENNPEQVARSWYMFFFQLPRLPDWLAARNDHQLLERALTGSSREGTFTAAELRYYREAWSRPGAVTSMINWYRAAARHGPSDVDKRITVPTLVLWGEKDVALMAEMAADSVAMCDDGQLVTFPENSHWLHLEQPRAVTELIDAFLRGKRVEGTVTTRRGDAD
ncbi:MAG: alpha/beta fold hydrolase [Myxococcota bacterium]